MGYALVGSLGPVNATVSNAPNTPSFAQATTSGNLLVAWMFSNSSSATNPFSTSATGWTLATTGGGSFDWTAIYYRASCGAAETAPTFTTGGTFAFALLGEFSGGAASNPADQTGTVIASTPTTVTNGAADAQAGDLIIMATGWNGGNTGPTTISTTMHDSNGSAVTPGQADNHTSAGTVFYDFAWGVAGAVLGASADTATATLGVFSGGGAALASFKPAAGGGTSHTATAALSVTPAATDAPVHNHGRTAALSATPSVATVKSQAHTVRALVRPAAAVTTSGGHTSGGPQIVPCLVALGVI